MFRIAIDGTAAAGKGTLAKLCSKVLGFMYVDTGAMYRSVAMKALEAKVNEDDELSHAEIAQNIRFEFVWDGDELQIWVDGENCSSKIRTEAVGDRASTSSAYPSVRSALLEQQRQLGRTQNVIMDGRDIGTVVLPNAELKVYVDAQIEVRAQRRLLDVQQKEATGEFERVLKDLKLRDHRDMNRKVAPLKKAADAKILDTTQQSIISGVEQVFKWYLAVRYPHLKNEQLKSILSSNESTVDLPKETLGQVERLKDLIASQKD